METKFGVLVPEYPPAEEALAAVKRTEDMGWDFVDYPDQVVSTNPYGQMPIPAPADDPSLPSGFFGDPWMSATEMAAAAAVVTERVPITIGVIDALRRTPSLMAQQMLTLDHLSKGRMTFAIATGENKQFRPYGIPRDKPITRMIEAVETWHALWDFDGTPITRESPFYPLDKAVLPLRPYNGRKPTLLAVGAGPKVFDLAGRLCDGWLTYLPGGLADDYALIAECVQAVKRCAEAAGRDPDGLRFNAMVNMAIAETDEKAWELVRNPVCGWISLAAVGINSGEAWANLGYENPLGKDFVWSRDMDALVVSPDSVPALADQVPDQVADSVFVWGTPERAAARIQRMLDAGITEICMMNVGAGADPEYSTTFNGLASDIMVRLGHAPLKLDIR
jgi:phthiodiolone/phenolphthiodiolone dimycocerosates ketoreductase